MKPYCINAHPEKRPHTIHENWNCRWLPNDDGNRIRLGNHPNPIEAAKEAGLLFPKWIILLCKDCCK